jgi:PAS domain S-box-containing protein
MPASGDRTLPQAGSRWPSRLPRIGRYGLAVLSVSAAAALIVTWERHMETAPASLLFCAVMLSAWLGGLRVGLLATVLSLLAFDFYLVSPSYSLAVQIASAPRVVVFALAALFVCLLAAAQKRARQSLQKARDALAGKVEELGNANQALQLENAERCQTEALLRESEQRLRALVVGSVDEIVFEFGADGTYLNVWTSDESLLVRPRSELIGRRAREVMGEETGKAYLEAFGRVLASGRAESQEYPLQLSTGRRWFLSRISPIPAADGSRRTVSVLARDVTERKRGEQRLGAQYAVTRTLAESENLAAATPHLLRGIGDNLEWKWGALWVVDRQSGRLRCRSTWQVEKVETGAFDAISRATEFAPGQGLAGWVWQRAQPIWMVDATSEAELPRAPAAETVGLRGAVAFPILLDREVLGVVEFFDSVARPPDEEQLATLSAIGSQIGQFLRRKRAEENLRENEKRFRALIEHSSDAILMFDGQGTILYASPPFERVLGYAPEEAVGRNRLSFVEPDQRDDAAADFAGVLQEPGRFATLHRRVRHKDGSWRWLETTVTNWLDEPAVQAVVANVRDITERKQAEEALRESEQRFRDHAETASDFLWETGPDHHFTYTTEPLNALGIAPARLVGAKRWDLAADVEEDAEKWREHIALVEAHLPFRGFVYKTLRADGSAVYVSASAKPIFDTDGVFQGYRGAASDVTAAVRARQTEEALQQARSELAHISRVTTLGEITASIAHEINQPLAAVVTNASAGRRWLAGQPPNMTEAREALDRIVRDGNRASEIIRRIRALLNKSGAPMQRLSINETILEVIALIRNELDRNRVALKLQLSHDLPPVKGDRIQLQQVILNLIVNATEAMREHRLEDRELLVGSETDESNSVLVSVKDSGPGLDVASIDQLFDAFYTTKRDGMGMGLAISRSIVEAHGGRMWATSNEPRGAIFHFALPMERDEEALSQRTIASSQLV